MGDATSWRFFIEMEVCENMEHHVRSLLGFAMLLLSCTACSFTEEAIDNQETQVVTVMEDVQMDRPQEMERYMVYRAVPKSQEALDRPEWYYMIARSVFIPPVE